MRKESLYLSTVDESAAELSRKYGLGLELAEFCTAWNLDDEFSVVDQKVQQEIAGLQRLTLHGPYNELFPCAIDRRARALARERYLQALETAVHYGAEKVILHGGFDPHLYFPVWFIQESTAFFRDFVKEIPENMTVCLENVLEDDPALLTEIIRSVDDSRLRICLDVGHAQAYSRFSPIEWISRCGNLIDHFHVHNNDGTRDSHSPLSEGIIPMNALFAEIEHHCPQATVTLELPQARSSLVWLEQNHILEAQP